MTSATLGIDLASQAASTAVCLIEWRADEAEIVVLAKGRDRDGQGDLLDDEVLIHAMTGTRRGWPKPSKVGIDAPFGWPVDFVRAIADLDSWPLAIGADRARLLRRATDHWIHTEAGKEPLSVSSDRIAYPAMRAAGLLSHLATKLGVEVDRTGRTGLVCEVYPDPAIRQFGLWPEKTGNREVGLRSSYKRDNRDVRVEIVDRLCHLAPWLKWTNERQQACRDSDDHLDALMCALIARATELEKTECIPDSARLEAEAEGWIQLPKEGTLSALLHG